MKKRPSLNISDSLPSTNSFDKNYEYSLNVKSKESKTEKDVRLTIKKQASLVLIIKDIILFIFSIGFLITLVAFCFSIINNNTASIDDKKWAMALFASIGSATIGYLTGKLQKENLL